MVNVAFEGIDGSGKSTQLRIQYTALSERYGARRVGICHLNSLDHHVGNIVRRLYKLPKNHFTSVLRNRIVQETLYALCSRLSVLRTSGLDRDVVLSDRSLFTPFAHHTGKIPEWYLTFIEPKFYPDIVVYMDISPEVGLERMMRRKDLKAQESLSQLKAFHLGYASVMGSQRPRVLSKTKIIQIDGEQPLERVTSEVREALVSELDKRVLRV